MATYSPADLMPVQLPDGSVVRMRPTPGLEAYNGAGFTSGTPPVGAGGGGDAAPAEPMTPGQQDVAKAIALQEADAAGVGKSHQSLTPNAGRDPFGGQAFDEYTSGVESRKQGSSLQDVPDKEPEAAAPAASPRPARLIKGGPTKTSWQVQPGAAITGERIDAIEKAYNDQIEQQKKQRDDLETAQANARIDQKLALQQKQEVLDQQRVRRIGIDQDIADLNKQRDAMQTRARAHAVDPSRLIKEKPWLLMLTALGSAFQGAAQRTSEIYAGQPFQPIATKDAMKDAIEMDIRNQQLEYEQATDQATLADNRYKEALDLYGTPEAAAKAIEAQDLELAQSWVDMHKQQMTDQDQIAALEAVSGDLERSKQQKLAELEDATAAKVTENWQNIPDRWVGGAGAGRAGGKVDATAVRDARKKLVALHNVKNNVEMIDSLVKSGDAAEAESLAAATIPIVSQAYGSGTPGEAEGKRFLEEVMGDPGSRILKHIPWTAASTGEGRRATFNASNDKRIKQLEAELKYADPNAKPPE